MEQYYYNHMNKPQQATYHSIFVGVKKTVETREVRPDQHEIHFIPRQQHRQSLQERQ